MGKFVICNQIRKYFINLNDEFGFLAFFSVRIWNHFLLSKQKQK